MSDRSSKRGENNNETINHKINMDEMRTKWAELDKKLEKSVQINKQLLNMNYLERANSELKKNTLGWIFEIVMCVVCLLLMGSFLFENRNEFRFFLPGLFLHLFWIADLGAIIHLMIATQKIDYAQPVIVIQHFSSYRLISTQIRSFNSRFQKSTRCFMNFS